MNVELIGGPKDGDVVAVPDHMYLLDVAIPPDLMSAEPTGYITLRVGRYQPITEADRLLHRWTWREPT